MDPALIFTHARTRTSADEVLHEQAQRLERRPARHDAAPAEQAEANESIRGHRCPQSGRSRFCTMRARQPQSGQRKGSDSITMPAEG